MVVAADAHSPVYDALLKLSSAASQNNDIIAAVECIICDCAVAQEAFDTLDVFAALFSIVSQSASACTHAEVCRVLVALLRGRGSASRAWCDVIALSDCIRAICDVAHSFDCEAAAELLDCLADEMDKSVAEALHARGDVSGAVQHIAAGASSHWCRVMLLSAVHRFILLFAAFRSSLCSRAVVAAAQAAMMGTQDDYECGTVANAVGELVRGHAANKAAFSSETTCMGLKRMAEAAVEHATIQVVRLRVLFPLRRSHGTLFPGRRLLNIEPVQHCQQSRCAPVCIVIRSNSHSVSLPALYYCAAVAVAHHSIF